MTKAKYFDKKIGWLLYPILGLSFIFFANDNDFKTLIRLPSFKWDVVFSVIAVSITGLYLAWLVRYLDNNKKIAWHAAFKKRAILQFCYGIAIPLFFCIGLELVYLSLIGLPVSQSSIYNLELPLAFIYLFLLNLLYYLNHVSIAYQNKLRENGNASKLKGAVRVTEGAKEHLMPVENIAFIKSTDKILWLHTDRSEQFHLNGSLNEWEAKLPKQYFYRLNRQFITHRDAIQSIEPTETRRLKVFLKGCNDDIYIPKTKATDFRNWWQN